MLIKEPIYKEGAIVVLKLVTGEEIVTKVLEFDATRFTILAKQPLQVQIVSDGKGGRGKALLPLMMLAPESDITLELDKVMGSTLAPEEVAKAYTQETSGIILAQ